MDAAVEVRGLRKRYGDIVAVDDLDLDVRRGEIFGLTGPNGSGKTTTVECVQGLRRPDAGRLRVLGVDPVTHGDAVRRRIGSQLQESALPERIRVWEALDVFAALADRPVDWRAALRDWRLEELRDRSFASLSGGQRQRLFVALALLGGPEIVVLDEMTTGLDPAARRVAWELVERVRADGTTVLLVTHFMEEAERLCDRVAIVDRGRLAAMGTPGELAAAHGGGTRIRFAADGHDVRYLQRLAEVERLERHGSRVEIRGSGAVLALVAAQLVEHGIVPTDLRVEQPTLEDAFLRLTGGPA